MQDNITPVSSSVHFNKILQYHAYIHTFGIIQKLLPEDILPLVADAPEIKKKFEKLSYIHSQGL